MKVKYKTKNGDILETKLPVNGFDFKYGESRHNDDGTTTQDGECTIHIFNVTKNTEADVLVTCSKTLTRIDEYHSQIDNVSCIHYEDELIDANKMINDVNIAHFTKLAKQDNPDYNELYLLFFMMRKDKNVRLKTDMFYVEENDSKQICGAKNVLCKVQGFCHEMGYMALSNIVLYPVEECDVEGCKYFRREIGFLDFVKLCKSGDIEIKFKG